MWADTLRFVCRRERSGVGVFYYFELVLLVFVEEAVEGCGGEVERF